MTFTKIKFHSLLFLFLTTSSLPSHTNVTNTCWQSTKIVGGTTYIIHGLLVAYNKFNTGYGIQLNSIKNVNEFLYETAGAIAVGGLTVKSGIDGLNTNKATTSYTLFKLWVRITGYFPRTSKQ